MYTLIWATVLLLCAAKIGWMIADDYKRRQAKQRAAIAKCAEKGHQMERIYAMDDPRLPVDKCKLCKYQTPVRYPCPHCGKDLDWRYSRRRR